MEYIEVSEKYPKELYEVLQALNKVVEVSIEALKDGFQPESDIPAIVLQSAKDMMVAMSGIDQIPSEFSEDPEAFLKASAAFGAEIVAQILNLKKE